jgi:hypothetical protein
MMSTVRVGGRISAAETENQTRHSELIASENGLDPGANSVDGTEPAEAAKQIRNIVRGPGDRLGMDGVQR